MKYRLGTVLRVAATFVAVSGILFLSATDSRAMTAETHRRVSRPANTTVGDAVQTRVTHDRLVMLAQRLQQELNITTTQVPGTGAPSQFSAALAGLARTPINPRLAARGPAGPGIPPGWNVRRHEANGTPVSIMGRGLAVTTPQLSASAAAPEIALAFVNEYRTVFQLEDPVAELAVARVTDDPTGRRHVALSQRYKGIPVWAHNIVVHLDADNGLYAVNARYAPTPSTIDPDAPRIPPVTAIHNAVTDLAGIVELRPLDERVKSLLGYTGPSADLTIWIDPHTQMPHLAWHVQIRPNDRDWWYYFVAAGDGRILEQYNNTRFDGPATGSGLDLFGVSRTVNSYEIGGTYYMIDASRPIWQSSQPDILDDPRGALRTLDLRGNDAGYTLYQVESADNTWNDPISVSAHYHVSLGFEYFYDTHGREAIDDNGGTMTAVIHVTDGRQDMDNAFWWNGLMWFGDGAYAFEPLAKALDVVVHEMGHGVTEYTINLEYQDQSGALDESFSDVWGAMADRDDWLLGEDVVNTSVFPSGAMRNMEDPHNGGTSLSDNGWQPAHMSEYQNVSYDNGGVHINSGITNKAAYLIGTAIGRDKLERIYYHIEASQYLNRLSNFCDMRWAALQSATDLYGDPSAERDAVESAFADVGITDACGGADPPDDPPELPSGDEWIAMADASDHTLLLAPPVISLPSDVVRLTWTQVNIDSEKPIDVAYDQDGPVILFVDADHDLRMIRPGGGPEEVVSSDGVWWSVAASRNLARIALTTADSDSAIHILDLVDPEASKTIHLYSPTTIGDDGLDITLFAEVMDFDGSGQYVLYDAFNRFPQDGGGTKDYWEVNMVDVASENIVRMIQPQPEGVNAGNPSFAQTSGSVFTFDLIDENECINDVMAYNLYTGDVGLIKQNGCNPINFQPNPGFPHYSPNDGWMIVQWRDPKGRSNLLQIPIDPDDPTLTVGSPDDYLADVEHPVWFATDLLTDVEDENDGGTLPEAFSLQQNYPNPFNAATIIRFTVDGYEPIRLEIFDILGRRVATLIDGPLRPGPQQVSWTGVDDRGDALASGVYFYRLTTGGDAQTKSMVLLK